MYVCVCARVCGVYMCIMCVCVCCVCDAYTGRILKGAHEPYSAIPNQKLSLKLIKHFRSS